MCVLSKQWWQFSLIIFLTHCMLGNFAFFLSSADFVRMQSSKEANSMDPDQAWHFVRDDLGPSGLNRLSAANKSHQWRKTGFPQALETMENLENHLKKVPCIEKSWSLKTPE